MLITKFPPRPQTKPKAAETAPAPIIAAPSTPDPYADLNDDELFDEEGRLLIRTPVLPGPCPAPTVITPEIAAQAIPEPQRPPMSSNVVPRRPKAPSKPRNT